MSTWDSRGLRGSTFEDFINHTNELYKEQELCLIQKIPTPITPINISPDHKQITLAYFDKQSTVDYLGVVQGIPVCFDAKECAKTTFPLSNIHEHQFKFMEDMEKQEGIAFILIFFTEINKYYYMRFVELKKFIDRRDNGGRKSFRVDELDEEFFFDMELNIVPYLKKLQKDLDLRNDEIK